MEIRAITLLLAVCVEARKGGKGVKIDLAGNVLNPDLGVTKMVMEEFNEGERFVQGDILMQKGTGDRNAHKDVNKLWPQGTVPYVINPNIELEERRRKIQEAIADYNEYTCVKFTPRTNEEDYVSFTREWGGCFAQLGRGGGMQEINLGEGCWDKGTVIHEMLHTLGFAHEQSRGGGRDRYITVNYDAIPEDWKYQYRKLPASEEDNLGFHYDYSSVMHYPGLTFGGYDKPSIVTKDPADQGKIGQRAGFSKQDVEEVNRYYKCRGKVSGVGGENGCLDRQVDYCQNILGMKEGPNRHCAYPHILKDCKKSCRACGANATRRPMTTTTTPKPCQDDDHHYCTNLMGLRKGGENEACQSDQIAGYCRLSCETCR